MPWKETDVKSERIRFVAECLAGRKTMSALCREYGISRKTGYKWKARGEAVERLSELAEKSRRPHRCAEGVSEKVVDRVVALRERYGWGSRKLQCLLVKEGVTVSRSTIDRILERKGLHSTKPRHRPATKRYERKAPNELVQMDFKGEFEVGGRNCYPLALVDDHSRYLLALAPLRSEHGIVVQRVLIDCMERYGVPEAILIDHGTPWWSSTNGHGLTRLGVFLIRQGVKLRYSGIGHPQTQGKVERVNRTLGDWLSHHGWPNTLSSCARSFEEFRVEYNEVRPHESLGLETPSTRYAPSPRAYQAEPRPWEYPQGSHVHRLAGNGCLRLNGRSHFVCHALAERRVRCEQLGSRILVSYRHMLIREIDAVTGRSYTVVKPYGPTGH